MRRNIVAGNWKMNLLAHEAAELFNEIQFYCHKNKTNCDVFIFPSAIYLASLSGNAKSIRIGAQNSNDQLKGAYTGEVSVTQLKSIGVDFSLVGHSERRAIYNESDGLINAKIKSLLSCEMSPVLCVGETLSQREQGQHLEVIENQLNRGLADVGAEQTSNIIVAYEPVWAIGTGKTATPGQAQEMHAYIRKILSGLYNAEVAANISILYGGSVKPDNARELFSKEDVDGGLVGGASLDAGDFVSIIQAFDA